MFDVGVLTGVLPPRCRCWLVNLAYNVATLGLNELLGRVIYTSFTPDLHLIYT